MRGWHMRSSEDKVLNRMRMPITDSKEEKMWISKPMTTSLRTPHQNGITPEEKGELQKNRPTIPMHKVPTKHG